MYFNHKNEINLDHLNNKKHSIEKNSINEDIPSSTTLKHGRREKFQEETMPFLGEYDPPAPYPVSSTMLHNNGSNSSGIGSYTGQGVHYGNAAMRNTIHREGRIVNTDIEDLSTDEDNTCPANNKESHDDMFDSMSSNPTSSIMAQEMSHPSALLNSIPPPPSEPPPSTPRDSYQESVFPKCSIMAPASHNGMQGIRGLMDQDHILQQIPGVMEPESNQIPYLLMGQNNNRVATRYSDSPNGFVSNPTMGTIGRYRNQMPMSEAAAMATLPHTHSQTGFGVPSIPRGPGSVSGTSNVYENPYNSLNRHNNKPMKTVTSGGFPSSNSNHEMGYPMIAPTGIPQNHMNIHYRQNSIRSPQNHSFSDPFFGIGKAGSGRCSWTCIRISLFALAILLLLSLIAYFAAKSVWLEGRLNKRFAQDPVVIGLFDPKNLPILILPPYSYKISLKPMGVWSGRWIQNRSDFLHFNFTINALTSLGVFLRINSVPTIVRYSFFDRISGRAWRQAILESSRNRMKRSISEPIHQESTGMIHFLEKGFWFISIVNDQPREENIHFTLNTKVPMGPSCPNHCNSHGVCAENGRCDCFTGFIGKECSIVDSPKICSGHGNYFQGRCLCNSEWKGSECQTIWFECETPSCSGNGDCVSGECICKKEYSGKNCSNVVCQSNCFDNGICQSNGICRCFHGWTGEDCSKKKFDNEVGQLKKCRNNGVLTSEGFCVCTKGYYGEICDKKKCLEPCYHGSCSNNGTCVCLEGYIGKQCNEFVCDPRCYQHGRCVNGKCSCRTGWNGKHCTLDGCPNHCGNSGQCRLNSALEYECFCFPTWKGISCNISKENKCDDGIDNDNDGLSDCQDPDCCPTEYCETLTNQKQKQAEESCPLIESLQLLLLTTKLARPGSAFHEQIEFLTKRKYTSKSLNNKKISIVRGKVIQSDGTPFQGCRVQDRMRLVNGHTFTDKMGLFDLVVEGGSLVQLEIIRHPASRFAGYYNVYVPINEFVNIGDFELRDTTRPKANEYLQNAGCTVDDKSVHDISVLEGPRIFADWSSDIIPIYKTDTLSMAFDNGVLVNSIDLKETGLKLMHRSSRVKGFKSSLLVLIMGKYVPPNLKEIRLKIDVAGQNISQRLEPDPYLTYTFHWDRLNAYKRLMYGLASLKVRVGYVYNNCSKIFWETKMTVINGHDLAAKDIGNWNLNNRHIFDFNNGIVYRGDGSHLFLTQSNWQVTSIAGKLGSLRKPDICSECDGDPKNKNFFVLNAVASDDKGRIIISDGKYIRILSKAGQFDREWAMLNPVFLKFINNFEKDLTDFSLFLTKHESNPSLNNDLLAGDPKFYISESHTKSIWIINPEKETSVLVVGDKCHEKTCIKHKLSYPKGMAMTFNFSLFFADGRSIKMVSLKDMTVQTVIGDPSALAEHAKLPGCFGGLLGIHTRLKWPTSVKYNAIDNSIYFIDNMEMVYRYGLNNFMVTIIAGSNERCPASAEESDTILATSHKFTDIRDIDISPSGEIFIAEKNAIWILKSDGYLYSVHGDIKSKTTFESISSITVTMFGELIVADNGQQQVFSVHHKQSTKKNNLYQVLSPDTREMYFFNSDGQHDSTESSITGTKLYSLHFRLNSINGWLSRITSPSDNLQFKVHRDTQSRATQLETPSGINYNVTLDERKRITNLAMPSCFWKFQYNEQDLLISIQQCDEIAPYRFSYYPESGKLKSVIRPSGITTSFVEHPVFYEFIQSKFKFKNLITGPYESRLASVAITPYNSLIYSFSNNIAPNLVKFNSHANIILLQLQVIGPSNQIRLFNGFQPKMMSLTDFESKIEYTTHYTIFSYLKVRDGLKFTRKIIFKTTESVKEYTSQWIYYITQRPSPSIRQYRDISPVIRHYQVNNEDSNSNESPYSNDESTSHFTLHPRIFRMNDKKKLQVRYDSSVQQETYSIFKTNEETAQQFLIQYNQDHQIVKIIPKNINANLAELSVTYTRFGQIDKIIWVKPLLEIKYDSLNRTSTIYNAYVNDIFTYKYESDDVVNKIVEIYKGTTGKYVFLYDSRDKLQSIITPNNVHILIKQLISIGYRRILYQPYGVIGNFIYDFDTIHGNLFRLIYPSRMHQINFFYSTSNQLTDVIYGSERISFVINETNSLVNKILKTHFSFGFSLVQTFEYYGPLLSAINFELKLPSPNEDIISYNSRLIYSYDAEMLIKKISLILIDKRYSKSDLRLESSLFFNTVNQLIQWDEFIFEYDLTNVIKLPHDQSQIETKFNHNGQLSKRVIRLGSNQLYIDVSYKASKNPLLVTAYKIKKTGSSEDVDTKLSYYIDSSLITNVHSVDSIQYQYYSDGRLMSMRVNTGAPIDYIYDEKNGLLKICGLVSYFYNDDGFLTQKRNGKQLEKFSYNAFGLLQEYLLSESNSKIMKRIEYFYDSRHRLILQRDLMNPKSMLQYFYVDPLNLYRLTHMFDHKTKQLSTYYYEPQSGHLFSIRVDKTLYYVLCDFLGSPRTIVSSNAEIVWDRDYDIFGETKSLKDWNIHIPIGFSGHIYDSQSGMIFMKDRIYDPNSKSFAGFQWFGLFYHLKNMKLNPFILNSYQYHLLLQSFDVTRKMDFSHLLKPEFWFLQMGINTENMITEKPLQVYKDITSLPQSFLLKSVFEQFKFDSVHTLLTEHNENSFQTLSSLQNNELLAQDSLPYYLVNFNQISSYIFSLHENISISLCEDNKIQIVTKIDALDSSFELIANALFRNTTLLNIYSTRNDFMLLYLIKDCCELLHSDLQDLGMVGKSQQGFLHNFNLSVTTHSNKMTEVILHQRHFIISVIYGSTVKEQFSIVTKTIKSETERLFWSNKRRQLSRNELMRDQISIDHKDKLMKYELIRNFVLDAWFNLTEFPLIFDDPSVYRIKLEPSS